jgi:hypothetical protein
MSKSHNQQKDSKNCTTHKPPTPKQKNNSEPNKAPKQNTNKK